MTPREPNRIQPMDQPVKGIGCFSLPVLYIVGAQAVLIVGGLYLLGYL
jgi:hypothetical protein